MKSIVVTSLLVLSCLTALFAGEAVEKNTDTSQPMSAVRWTFNSPKVVKLDAARPSFHTPVLAEGEKTVAYCEGQTLRLLNRADGKELWSRELPNRNGITVAVFEDLVFAGAEGANDEFRFYAMDARTGQDKQIPFPRIQIAPDFGMRRVGKTLFLSWSSEISHLNEGLPLPNKDRHDLVVRVDGNTGRMVDHVWVAAPRNRGWGPWPLPTSSGDLLVGVSLHDGKTLQQKWVCQELREKEMEAAYWFGLSSDHAYGVTDTYDDLEILTLNLEKGEKSWQRHIKYTAILDGHHAQGLMAFAPSLLSEKIWLPRPYYLQALNGDEGKELWMHQLPFVVAGYGSGGPYYEAKKTEGPWAEYIDKLYQNYAPRHFPDTQFRVTVPQPYEFLFASPAFPAPDGTVRVIVNFRNVMRQLFGHYDPLEKEVLELKKRGTTWTDAAGQPLESRDLIVLFSVDAKTGAPKQHQVLLADALMNQYLQSEDGRTLFILTTQGAVLRVDLSGEAVPVRP